jgi:hypothetical protein
MSRFCVACFSGEYPFEQRAGGFVRESEGLCEVVGG